MACPPTLSPPTTSFPIRSSFSNRRSSSPRKPDWLLLDFAQYWAPPVAAEVKVPCAYFSVIPALNLAFFWGDVIEAAEVGCRRRTLEELTTPPKWVPFPSKLAYLPYEARSVFWLYQENASGMERFSLTLKGCRSFVVRSFTEVEPAWVYLVGELYNKPVIPAGLLTPSRGSEEYEEKSGQADRPASELKILDWLSEQPLRSVVFVAFGSEGSLSAELQREVDLGFELTKAPFLWALRPPADADGVLIPVGFGERTRGYGLVATSWVTQMQVLGHPLVGFFFTLCGWGSVIESFQFGHPLVMLPSVLDQGLIAQQLAAEEVGVVVARDGQDCSFTREAAIRKVMGEGERNSRKQQEVFANKISLNLPSTI